MFFFFIFNFANKWVAAVLYVDGDDGGDGIDCWEENKKERERKKEEKTLVLL